MAFPSTYLELKNDLKLALSGLYDDGESESIAKIYVEDRFGRKAGQLSQPLDKAHAALYQSDKRRLCGGEPVQYVVGKAFFFGHFFEVNPRVLIPRAETEELVDRVIQQIRRRPVDQRLTVLDVGTGSGCIAISIKKACPDHRIIALDVSRNALEQAKLNAGMLDTVVEFVQMDVLDRDSWNKLPPFDFLVSNPPYVARSEMGPAMPASLTFEPDEALFPPGQDMLVFYRFLGDLFLHRGNPEAEMFLEISEFRIDALQQLAREQGLREAKFHRDLQGKYRIMHAVRK